MTGNGELLDDQGMVAEHDGRLVALLGELGAEPGELFGRERAGIVAPAGLVVRVDPDDPEAPELATEVGRLVSGEEVVVEAVVALPLTDATRGIGIAGMRAIVIAARDEVVAAIFAESSEQLPRLAEIDRRGLGGDVAGGQEERLRRARSRPRRAT